MSVINGIAFSNPNAAAEENEVMAAIIEKKVKQKEFEKFLQEYRLANPEFDLTISSKVDVKWEKIKGKRRRMTQKQQL